MSSKTLLQWLQGAGLEALYDTFVAHDVTAERLATLQFHDYDRMEIIEPPLRQKLFRLVQMVKREAPPAAAPAPTPAPVPQPSQPAFAPTQVLPRNILPPAAAPNPVRAKPAPSQLPQPSVKAQPRYEEPPQQQVPQQAAAPRNNRRVSAVPQQAQQPLPPPQQQAPAPRPAPIPQQQQPPPPQQQQQDYDEDDNGGEVFEDDVDEDVDDDYDGSLVMDSGGGGLEDVPKIRVAVRKRPLNSKERDSNQVDVVTVKQNQVTIHEPKQKVDLTRYVESHKFSFDEVFADESTNEEIYQATCKPLVHFFINAGGKKGGGGKATCFAYGQTGSGKSKFRPPARLPVGAREVFLMRFRRFVSFHVFFLLTAFTMMGDGQASGPAMGLYALAARDMFRLISSGGEETSQLQVYVSFFEIYGGKLFDLLNDRKKLVMREDGAKMVNIVGLRERKCSQVSDLLELMAYGNAVRSTGSTGANMDSSRSHAILQIVLKKPDSSAKSDVPSFPGQVQKSKLKIHGKFSFIDLAGSERAADTSDNDRRTRLEGAEINKSLLALKECIRALDQGGKHLPVRGQTGWAVSERLFSILLCLNAHVFVLLFACVALSSSSVVLS